MRGKRPRVVYRHAPNRNIPAYAGKTHSNSLSVALREEHPRVCGENDFRFKHIIVEVGTSPRMRGKPDKVSGFTISFRNIPAYAGKTALKRATGNDSTEHPRVCGENFG